MINYWLWSSVDKRHLDQIVVATINMPIMIMGDILLFPFEIIGVIIYLVIKLFRKRRNKYGYKSNNRNSKRQN